MNKNKIVVLLISLGISYLLITSIVDFSTILGGGENITGPVILGNKSSQVTDYYIYLYDISTGKMTVIASNKVGLFNPAIYMDKVVYTNYENGNGDIYLYDIGTGEIRQITSDPYEQDVARIYGDIIVWDDSRSEHEEGGRSIDRQDVYMYDMGTGIESVAIKTLVPDRFPDIYGDIIVGEVYLRGIHGNVYIYNITSGILEEITTETEGHERIKIHKNIIVWYTGYPSNIHMYDLSTGRPMQITDSSGRALHPNVYENIVVYPKGLPDEKFDIYAYDIRTGSEIQITYTPDFSETLADIYGNRIAFVRMYSSEEMDIIIYDMDTGSEIKVGSPMDFNYGPQIYGSKVVWSAFDVKPS